MTIRPLIPYTNCERAAAEVTGRRRGGSLSCSIQSEQDLLIRDEANFSATQTLNLYEQQLLDIDPERVRIYLDENNLLKVNENETLKDKTKSNKEKMKYILNETNCIKGTRGLQHILEMLQSLGHPSYIELANIISTDYYRRMDQQYPSHEIQQPANVLRNRSSSKNNEKQKEEIVTEQEV